MPASSSKIRKTEVFAQEVSPPKAQKAMGLVQFEGQLRFVAPLGKLDAKTVTVKAWPEAADIQKDPAIIGKSMRLENND